MPDLGTAGRWLLIFGIVVAAAGGLLWLADHFGLPLGRLPGDIRIEREGFTCFMPLASSILISILLTLAINLIARWIAK
jgi:hypothetical protein